MESPSSFRVLSTYASRKVTTVRHLAEEAYEKFKNMHVKKRIPFN
jgi:hypothetical protein